MSAEVIKKYRLITRAIACILATVFLLCTANIGMVVAQEPYDEPLNMPDSDSLYGFSNDEVTNRAAQEEFRQNQQPDEDGEGIASNVKAVNNPRNPINNANNSPRGASNNYNPLHLRRPEALILVPPLENASPTRIVNHYRRTKPAYYVYHIGWGPEQDSVILGENPGDIIGEPPFPTFGNQYVRERITEGVG